MAGPEAVLGAVVVWRLVPPVQTAGIFVWTLCLHRALDSRLAALQRRLEEDRLRGGPACREDLPVLHDCALAWLSHDPDELIVADVDDEQ